MEIVVLTTQALIAVITLVSTVLSYLNRQNINRVRLEVNGRMDQLLKTEKGLSHAEGFIQGKNGYANGESKQTT